MKSNTLNSFSFLVLSGIGQLVEAQFKSSDIVILFDESGSMGEEQDYAAAAAVKLFEEFDAVTQSKPRFAVGGFRSGLAQSAQGVREITPDFVESSIALKTALEALVTSGGREQGYEALYDVFTEGDAAQDPIDWRFREATSICVLVFTDEESSGARISLMSGEVML